MGVALHARGRCVRELALILRRRSSSACRSTCSSRSRSRRPRRPTRRRSRSPGRRSWATSRRRGAPAGRRARPRAREQPDHHGLERRRPDRARLALRVRDRAATRPPQRRRSTSLFVLGIILPFQLAIIPLFVAMRHLGLVGNYLGMIVLEHRPADAADGLPLHGLHPRAAARLRGGGAGRRRRDPAHLRAGSSSRCSGRSPATVAVLVGDHRLERVLRRPDLPRRQPTSRRCRSRSTRSSATTSRAGT